MNIKKIHVIEKHFLQYLVNTRAIMKSTQIDLGVCFAELFLGIN